MGSLRYEQWTGLGLRAIAAAVVAALLLLAPASAGQAETEQCLYGGISAIGPVDADGNGDTTPDVVCLPQPLP